MANTIADFPPEQFAITAYCECGHSAAIDLGALSPDLTVDRLKAGIRCQVCGSRGVAIQDLPS